MAEWLVEEGIGEERALLVENGHVIAAKMRWPAILEAGAVVEGVLASRPRGRFRGRARFADGSEAQVDRLPADASEGATMRFEVVRAAISEGRRQKYAQVRPSDAPLRPAPTLAEKLDARAVHRFPEGLWEDILHQAWAGVVPFDVGVLHFSPTPAMLLVDLDGFDLPLTVSLHAVPVLASVIRRFDLGGMIGVDFPTIESKADRKLVDQALAEALADWDHERTAMNGFGFVQIVARLEGPSILHRLHHHRAAAAARMLLRRAERVEGGTVVEMFAHPAVIACLKHDWLMQLNRRLGRAVVVTEDATLALESGFAQAVSS